MTALTPTKTAIPDKFRIPLFLALIAAGLAGNYFKFPVFLNIDFLFGSIFALLALQFLGLGRGIVAAAVIAGYTYILWNHPYAIIIMTAEVGVVGWLVCRRKIGMLQADMVYWLIIGMPLVYLFYHVVMQVPVSNAYIVMSKQAVNGIANALFARLIFTVYVLWSRSSVITYREIVYNLLSFFVLCPALLLLAIGSRTDFSETDQHIRTTLIQESQSMADSVERWVLDRTTAIVNLAEMAAARSPRQMQPFLEHSKRSDVNFLRIGLLDRAATITAYFPLIDELGQHNIGKNFADRPFIPKLKQTLKPMLSEVVMGRIGTPRPMVTMLAPVVIDGEYGGYITGILSLQRIKENLDKHSSHAAVLYTLIDKNSNVIMTNRTDQKVMTPFVRGEGTYNLLDNGISQWLPEVPANISIMERWQKSFYVAEKDIGTLAEWKLILEQPVAPFQKTLYANYTGKLFLLFLILLLSLALAELLSRKIVTTLGQLGTLTQELPAKFEAGDTRIAWPESGIEEAHQLITNFRETADTLSEKFIEIRRINESLEQKVEERTHELKVSRDQWELTFDTIPDYITILDLHHHIMHANRSMLEVLNSKREGCQLGEPCYKIVHGLDAPPVYCPHSKLLLDGQEHTEEVFEPLLGKTLLVTVTPFHDADGKVTGSIHVARDISERKLLENELQMTNEYNRGLIETSLDIMVSIGPDGRITDVNQAAEVVTGFSREMLINSDFSNYVTDAEKARAGLQQVFLNGSVRDYPLEIRHRSGNLIPALFNATVYLDNINNAVGVFAVARDISDLKNAEAENRALEQQLRQTQKLESLGVLAGGIAHDFNNILAIIICNCELAMKRPNMVGELIPEIEQAAQRAAELCRQMLAYAGKTQYFMKQVNLTALLVDMLSMLKATINQNVVITSDLSADIPTIKCDPGQIRQIVMNLIINAAESVGEAQGEIVVSLKKTAIHEEHPEKDHLGKDIPSGSYVCLEVTDNGCGMDDETRLRIFEPFFTTKFTGRGLGMSATLGIITSHGGALQLSSQPGHGSTFKVYLPVPDSASAVDDSIHQAAPASWQGSGTILLVEDEPQLMMVAKNLIKAIGFTVYEATNGREALELYRKNAEYITLVVTDIGMPVMNGYELFLELKKINPELPIIISSGFGDEAVISRMADAKAAGFLSKPYSFDQLRTVLRSVVEKQL